MSNDLTMDVYRLSAIHPRTPCRTPVLLSQKGPCVSLSKMQHTRGTAPLLCYDLPTVRICAGSNTHSLEACLRPSFTITQSHQFAIAWRQNLTRSGSPRFWKIQSHHRFAVHRALQTLRQSVNLARKQNSMSKSLRPSPTGKALARSWCRFS